MDSFQSLRIQNVCLVAFTDEAFGLQLGSQLLDSFFIQVQSSDLCACLGIGTGHIAAQNAACTGDNDYLAGKITFQGKIDHDT